MDDEDDEEYMSEEGGEEDIDGEPEESPQSAGDIIQVPDQELPYEELNPYLPPDEEEQEQEKDYPIGHQQEKQIPAAEQEEDADLVLPPEPKRLKVEVDNNHN